MASVKSCRQVAIWGQVAFGGKILSIFEKYSKIILLLFIF